MNNTAKIAGKGDWGHSTFIAYFDPKGDYKKLLPKVTAAVSICFDSQKNLFLTKHKNGGFDLIGGKIEKDETVEETLKREALEEAGVELTSWKYVGYYQIDQKPDAPEEFKARYPKDSYILFFIAEGKKVTEPFGDEIEEVRTFSIDEVKDIEIAEHPILNEILKQY